VQQTDKQQSGGKRKRLGDFLVENEMISAADLGRVVEHQSIYGGKFGTCLLELRLLEENVLAKLLSRQLMLHYIDPDQLMNIAPEILRLIPPKIALRYFIVPYYRDEGKLFVAMGNTANRGLITKLEERLKLKILPLAMPEVRVVMALNKHYGMPMPPRFKALAAEFMRLAAEAAAAADANGQNLSADEEQSVIIPKHAIEVKTDDVTTWPLLGEDDEDDGDDYHQSEQIGERPEGSEEKLNTLLRKLVTAENRNDIGRAIVNYLTADYPRSALFMVRSNLVTGWMFADETMIPQLEQVTVSLQEFSVFSLVANSRAPYLGPVVDNAENRKLTMFFGTQPPQTALVLPLTVQERLVGMLYLQDEPTKLEMKRSELQYIVGKAEMAFRLLILRNKILNS